MLSASFLAVVVAVAPVQTAPSSARDVSALLAPIRAKHDVPGMTAAVTSGSKLVASGADGVRKRGEEKAITIDDRMHLGSCTKSMTATLCAKLVETGKLDWTTSVVDAFKDRVETIDPGWKATTLELLLANRGGAPADLDADGLWETLWASKRTPREQRMQLVAGVLKRPPEATPRTKFIYSNAGFSIAGAMAECALDMAWEDLIAKHVFEPLSIRSYGFGPPGKKGALDAPLGHRANGTPVDVGAGADNPAAIAPAGSAHMPIGEWAKFVAAHVRGESEGGLVAKETFVKLHTPLGDGDGRYALGWSVTEREWGGRVLTHDGSNTMWYCVAWLAPDADFAVLVAANQGGDAAATACDEAASALIRDHRERSRTK